MFNTAFWQHWKKKHPFFGTFGNTESGGVSISTLLHPHEKLKALVNNKRIYLWALHPKSYSLIWQQNNSPTLAGYLHCSHTLFGLVCKSLVWPFTQFEIHRHGLCNHGDETRLTKSKGDTPRSFLKVYIFWEFQLDIFGAASQKSLCTLKDALGSEKKCHMDTHTSLWGKDWQERKMFTVLTDHKDTSNRDNGQNYMFHSPSSP